MTNVDGIPQPLRSLPQWVCWAERERDGKQTKVPIAPDMGNFASVQDSETWASFEEAMKTASRDGAVAGIGFVFTDNDPFVGVDLDDCRDPSTGEPDAWARAIIDELDSFTEVSPSGTGYHVYVRGKLPDGGNRSGNIECYETARFFTVTGEHVAGTPMEIADRTAALVDIHTEHIAPDDAEMTVDASPSPSTVSIDDEELLSRAMQAKNGPKFTRLWNGDTSGYDSQSEADMALCCLLAFWTQKDAAQMDRLFRQSHLYRGKWDEKHYSGGKTYGEGTVERAIAVTSDVFEPIKRRKVTADEPAEAGVGESGRTSPSSTTRSPGNAASVDADHSVTEVRDKVAALERTVDTLRQMNQSLEAQHEHLYDALQDEQEKREQLSKRVAELESAHAPERASWLDRVFGL